MSKFQHSKRLPCLKAREFLLIMKLTFLAIFLLGMQVSAKVYSQEGSLSFQKGEVRLGKAFNLIERKSNYRFFYNNRQVPVNALVMLSADKASINQVLNNILDGLGLHYRILDNKVVMITPSGEEVQAVRVTGTVRDSSGNPLVGVSVQIKGSNSGTVTDAGGRYEIEAPEEATLVFSYIGYETREMALEGKTSLDITLNVSTSGLNEVVVVGYGTQQKKDLTGSVERVDIHALADDPNPSLGTLLHGTVPGLNVGATTTAGSDPSISIRGQTTISGSNSPLIVLDGIIYRGSLIDIAPKDIASIDVLKDASAAAIYGSQASNGVILITTKEGKTAKPALSYNFSYSLQQITNKSMLPADSKGFLKRLADRYLTESRTGEDLLTPNPDWDPTTKFPDPSMLKGYQNGIDNNYWKLLTNKAPSIQNHNVTISGKGDMINYFASFGFTNQENVVKNDNYKRYNYRINLNMKVTDWLNIGTQSFLTVSDYSGVSPSLGSVVGTPSMVPYLDSAGNYILQPFSGQLNPFLQMDQSDLDKRYNLSGTFYGDVNIPFIPGLNYRLNFSENSINGKHYNYNSYAASFTGVGSKENSSLRSYTLDNIVSYRREFNAHSIYATFVYGVEKRQYESTTATSQGFNSDILGYNALQEGQADLQSASSSAWQETSLYTMGRLVYSYKDRYIVTGTIRRDGFSGFGEKNKFGVFPSVALAWRVSEEPFFKANPGVFEDLKLRLSYGTNGNRTIDRYQTLSRLQSSLADGYLYGDNGAAEQGQFISSLSNPDLKWETTNSFNAGVDFIILKNRLSGSVDAYVATTHDVLYNINIPQMNGFGSIPTNIGKLENSGQELKITGVPVESKSFRWDVTLNFSRNRNKIVSILGPDKNGVEQDIISSGLFIGKPLGTIYDFNIIGMWQLDDYNKGLIPDGFTYGTYKVEDVNDDGKYTAADDRKILGYTDPSYRLSISSDMTYKNWNLKFLINSVQGGKNYYYAQPGTSLPNPDNVHNSNSFDFDYWTPEHPDARYRQLGYYTVALGETFSPYVQRSFVRLQDLSVSYDLSTVEWVKRARINGLRVYVSGANLITLSDWDGWDPETGTGLVSTAYPLLRSYSVGVNVQF